uniref:procollagen-proline 4-dioxygenase n=1 Tax=Leersia perrieri TaxID=77586 RepID=A0A0D9W0A7_9ORYZ
MAPFLLLVLLIAALSLPTDGGGFYDPARVTQLSWRPRAFLYSGFLSHAECDHLVNLAKGRMEKSMVADNDSGKSVMSQVRTSSGTFLAKHEHLSSLTSISMLSRVKTSNVCVCFHFDPFKDDIVAGIEKRVAAWTFLPEENAESIQILHYELGQKYDAHFDYFHDKNNLKRGGHRVATVLMYLTDVKKGGETVFPNAAGGHLQLKDETWSDCSRSGLAVKPKKGDALLFFSLHVNATTDPSSLHGSCPVIEGEKWSATKWIHVRSFDHPPDVRSDVPCSDENELCSRWAAVGECYKNPTYMVGTKDTLGFCRKSCGVCDAADA